MTMRHCRCPGCHRIVLDGREYCEVCIACECERKQNTEVTVDEPQISAADAIFLDSLAEPE